MVRRRKPHGTWAGETRQTLTPMLLTAALIFAASSLISDIRDNTFHTSERQEPEETDQ